jgi:hypothetical protein
MLLLGESRRLLWAIVVAAIVVVAGCGDVSGPSDSYVGTWHLRTVNRQPLPYDDGAGYVTLSETLTFQKDGSFEDDDSLTLNGQPLVESDHGSCTLKAPTQLVCTATRGGAYGFLWQGDSLYSVIPSGFEFVFKR